MSVTRETQPWNTGGTSAIYIIRRLVRLHPSLADVIAEAMEHEDDLLGLMVCRATGQRYPTTLCAVVKHLALDIEGESSWRKVAVATGILRNRIHPDDKHLNRLFKAWLAADEVSRGLFLAWAEADAIKPLRRGPRPSKIDEKAPPELKALADKMPLAELARQLDVSRETVRRWCAGACQIRPKTLDRMRGLLAGHDETSP